MQQGIAGRLECPLCAQQRPYVRFAPELPWGPEGDRARFLAVVLCVRRGRAGRCRTRAYLSRKPYGQMILLILPPSTPQTEPVTNDARSDARNTMTLATSSG